MNNIETETTEDRIISALGRISLTNDVSILYACESGSRAWGFASEDSDYDVRFIYAHHRDWYMSVDSCSQRDVIDGVMFPLPEVLDVAGWDIRKALNLIRQFNPSLIEWINSPITYVDRSGLRQALRQLVDNQMPRHQLLRHYLRMAKSTWDKYINGRESVRLKKYLYVMRPLCAALYIMSCETGQNPWALSVPPVAFDVLLPDAFLPNDVFAATVGLVERKKAGEELEEGSRIEVLDAFAEHLFDSLQETIDGPTSTQMIPVRDVNEIFENMLRSVV